MAAPITTLPDAPLPTDTQADFNTKAYAFVGSLSQFVAETNVVADAFNFNSTNSTSVTSLIIGLGAKTLTVEASKSYVKGMWITVAYTTSPIEWMSGVVTAYDAGTGALDFVAAETSGHTTTRAAWTISQSRSNSIPGITRSARTSNTILSVADHGKFIDITSGTFSQTFDAAATLGSGWWCRIRNSGSGNITLDPSTTETIDALATFIMYPGEMREIYCDGSNLFSSVISPFLVKIIATGTFVKPPGYKLFGTRMWSGGSSGQRTNSAVTISLGGGGGGCGETILDASLLGSSETITIGSGGAAVTTVANGNPGGDTTFGALFTVYGVGTGTFESGGSILIGANNGTGYGNFESGEAGTIYGGLSAKALAAANGANSIFGGGCGGSLDASAVVRTPGSSLYGGDGGAASSAANGTAGTEPGGGGGATQTGTQSGPGARGECWIWGII